MGQLNTVVCLLLASAASGFFAGPFAGSSPESPPVGALYHHEMRLSVLGAQRVWLKIHSRSHATLHMEGALRVSDRVRYKVHRNGSFTFDVGPEIERLLARLHTRIRRAHYDASTDVAAVVVAPPAVPNIEIRLHRVRTRHHNEDADWFLLWFGVH